MTLYFIDRTTEYQKQRKYSRKEKRRGGRYLLHSLTTVQYISTEMIIIFNLHNSKLSVSIFMDVY